MKNLNLAVLATKYIVENNSPILNVFHYEEDGFWQFSGVEIIHTDEDYRIISLEEIIKIDNSILELSLLDYGKMAYRKDKNSIWEIKDILKK